MLERVLSSGIIQVLLWMIAISFVLFILYKLFLSEGIFKRSRRSSVVTEIAEPALEKTVLDYDKLLHQSVKLADFRMAVRYLFLKTLARLSEKEYIQRSVDKTNYQYLQEIGIDKRKEFASLILTYEYSWYGNFPVTQEMFIFN